MTAQAFLDHIASAPEAFVLVANSIWGQCEDRTIVALFDTSDMAMDYIEASKLPEVITTIDHGRRMARTHRPDSILWDFNVHSWDMAVHRAPMHEGCAELPVNPEPPHGPMDPSMFPCITAESTGTVSGWQRGEP